MIEFTIIRHGQTEFNLQNRWQGHLDSPLTDLGQKQVALAANKIRSQTFDLIHCSPLGRTRQTLRVLKKHLNLSGIPIHFLDVLKERNVGLFGGLTQSEMELLYAENYKQRVQNPVKWRPPQGESTIEFSLRAKEYLKLLKEINPPKGLLKILVISHGGFCAQIHNQILNLDLKDVFDWKIPNASISKYHFNENSFSCISSDITKNEKFLLTL